MRWKIWILTLHSLLLAIFMLLFSAGVKIPSGLNYAAFFGINQNWTFLRQVPTCDSTWVYFTHKKLITKSQIFFNELYFWDSNLIKRENYLIANEFLKPKSRIAQNYVERWCEFRGLPPEEKITLNFECRGEKHVTKTKEFSCHSPTNS